jgi:hypothetical protein
MIKLKILFTYKEILFIFISAIISSTIIPFIFYASGIDFIKCFYLFTFLFCFLVVFIISDPQYLTRESSNNWDGTDNQ